MGIMEKEKETTILEWRSGGWELDFTFAPAIECRPSLFDVRVCPLASRQGVDETQSGAVPQARGPDASTWKCAQLHGCMGQRVD